MSLPKRTNKIYFFNIHQEEADILSKIKTNLRFQVVRNPLTAQSAKKYRQAEAVSVFINNKIDRQILDKLPNLKFIATRSTGFDHIDLAECRQRGIIVVNVPDYGQNTVAEFTFALILALSRKVYLAYEQVRELNFDTKRLGGFDLRGKTLGIIGLGHIGQYVAKIANGFEMKVVAYTRRPDSQVAKKLNVNLLRSLKGLLRQSDIITLHLPYNPQTHHLINKENIRFIKQGALLINTARGGLIDTEALLKALNKKILAGAALDVLEEEGLMGDEDKLFFNRQQTPFKFKTVAENYYLIERDDVIVTPHIAFKTTEAIERILKTTLANIEMFYKGKLQNLVKD